MRWQMFISWALSAKRIARLLHLAGHLDVGGVRAVDHDVGDVVAGQQRLERAVAQHVVADVLEQLLLLGDRHHDVLDLDDLADDVADLLARRRRLQLGELGEVDGVDQRVEDGRLDVVVLLGVPTLLRRRLPAWPGAPRFGRRGPAARRLLATATARRSCAGSARCGAAGSFGYACRTWGLDSSALELEFLEQRAPAPRASFPPSAPGGASASAPGRETAAAAFALAENSSIIWPLLEARPKVSASNSITCVGVISRATANSLAEISGRFGVLAMLMTRCERPVVGAVLLAAGR